MSAASPRANQCILGFPRHRAIVLAYVHIARSPWQQALPRTQPKNDPSSAEDTKEADEWNATTVRGLGKICVRCALGDCFGKEISRRRLPLAHQAANSPGLLACAHSTSPCAFECYTCFHMGCSRSTIYLRRRAPLHWMSWNRRHCMLRPYRGAAARGPQASAGPETAPLVA